MSEALLIFAAAVAAFATLGIAVGMLVAPHLQRMTEREDEDPGDGTD